MSGGAVVLLFLAGLTVYLIPWIVAESRKHHNAGAILALNLLLGWTFLGWAVALVWSLTTVQKPSA